LEVGESVGVEVALDELLGQARLGVPRWDVLAENVRAVPDKGPVDFGVMIDDVEICELLKRERGTAR